MATKIDRTLADASTGVDALTPYGVNLRLGYIGQFGANTGQNGWTVKLAVPF